MTGSAEMYGATYGSGELTPRKGTTAVDVDAIRRRQALKPEQRPVALNKRVWQEYGQ